MILVSCCNENGGIFGIDEDTLEVQTIVEEETRGLAVENGSLFAANSKGLRLYQRDDESGEWQLIAKHNADQNWHGVAIKDDLIYAAVSKSHTILCFDKSLNPYIPRKYEWPKGYPNDLCFFEDELYYCLPRIGQILKWPDPEPIIKGLAMPHSLVVTHDHIYTCNSAQGTVIRHTREDGHVENVLQVHEYTRGLCMDDGYLWMGLSKHRRSDQSKFRCGVIRKHLETGAEDFIEVPGVEVYDITKM